MRELPLRGGLLVLVAAILAGCTVFDKPLQPPKGKTADELYSEGSAKLGEQKYREALEAFYKLKYDYPAETASQLASLKIADAHYANKEYAEAIENYEEFRKLHPASSYIPYVIYMLGLSHFQRTLSVDRDQTNTQKALNEFQYLLTHFPDTPYAYDASEKAKECMKRLSDHEVYVGDFYYRMRKWPAAIQRYEAALSRYPGIPLEDETLFQLAEAYRQNQQLENAQKTLAALVQQYPKGKYADRAQRIMKEPAASSQVAPAKAAAAGPPSPKGPAEAAKPPPEPPKGKEPAPPAEERIALSPPPPAPSRSPEPAPEAPAPGAPRPPEPPKIQEAESTGMAPPEERPTPPSDEGTVGRAPTPVTAKVEEPPPERPPVPSQGADEPALRAAILPQKEAPAPEAPATAGPPPKELALEERPREVSLPTPREEPAAPSLQLASRAPESGSAPSSARSLGSQEGATPVESLVAANPSPSKRSKTGSSKSPDETMGFGELRGDRPINITADRMDAFQRENRVIFEGNVVVRQEETYIYARRITADMASQEDGGGIRKVVALRDVRITQRDRVATCDKAEFDHISRTIELSGKPKIWQGKDWIDGEKVVVQLDQEKMTVVGSQDKRVSAVLHPKAVKEASEGTPETPKGQRPSLTAPFAPPVQAQPRSEHPKMARAASPPPTPPAPPQPPPGKEEAPSSAPEPPAPPSVDMAHGSPSAEAAPPPGGGAPPPSTSNAEDEAARIASQALAREVPQPPAPLEERPPPAPERTPPPPSPAPSEDRAARIASQAVARKEPAPPMPPPENPRPTGERVASPPSSATLAESPEALLERWRKAWESKDLDGYMSCYSARFQTGKHDWKGWRAYKADLNRKYRNIRVEVEDVNVTTSPNGVGISFIQRYRADGYTDQGRKTLDLVKEDGRWKILKEGFEKLPSESASAGAQSKEEARPSGAAEGSSGEREAVMALLSEWQRCWEKRDFDCYFALYSPEFRGEGSDLKALRGKRAQQMALAQNIRVTLSEIQVSVLGETAQARFIQEFRSDMHQDRGRKLLELRREGGAWRIVEERWRAL
jgi:outer membrane protein assembly factor BamD